MMPGIYWQRPWLDGAEEPYREDFEEEDLDEFEEPLNEDAGIDAYYEDSQSPSIEDYLDTSQQAERLWGDEYRQRVRG